MRLDCRPPKNGSSCSTDLEAFIDEAERLGLAISISRTVLDAYLAASDLVSDAGDVTEVIRPMERAAGVALRKLRSAATAREKGER